MKRIKMLCGLMLLGMLALAQGDPQKHALIVAIGNYEPATGWDSISSLNDVPLISSALVQQGFSEDRIKVLRDAEAEKQAILDALADLSLQVSEGDVVVVHFSSHGQQIQDLNGDERDQLDEAIVAWGAPAYRDPAYKGERHLLDEELGSALERIRIALGPEGDLLMIVDACHSGTATRGPKAEEVSRGSSEPYLYSSSFEHSGEEDGVDMYEEPKVSTRGNDPMAPLVVFSAALAHERNFEYQGAGSLSIAFSRAMEKLDTNVTYRSLFNRIQKEMSILAPNQNPAIEGDADRKLFGGAVVDQQPFYRVNSVEGIELSIEGGIINGLNQGSIITVYPSGTVSDTVGQPLARGTVQFSSAFSCRAELDASLSGKPGDYWVFVEELALGDARVRLNTSRIQEPETRQRVDRILKGMRVAHLTDSAVEFHIEKHMDGIRLVRAADDRAYRNGLSDEGELEELQDAVLRYAQGKFLKGLEFTNPKFQVEIEIVPVTEVNGDLIIDSARLKEIRKNGITTFRSTDSAAIRIVNRSKYNLYYNIINISMYGEPFAFIPGVDEDPRAFQLDRGEDHLETGYVIEFGEPYGTETLKIFASVQPIDLTAIAGAHRGPKEDNTVELLFGDSREMGTRGPKVSRFESKTRAGTCTIVFEVVE